MTAIPDTTFTDIAKGNKSAFDSLFRQYYKPLCYFVYKMVRDSAIAEEIVQELFVQLWEKPPTVRIEVSVSSYLYRWAYNRTLNHLEKKTTRARNEKAYTDAADLVQQPEAIDDDRATVARQVHQAIDELPEKCREIFKLCKQQELTYSQAAQLLEVSEKTVENQMGIAMKKLRDRLLPIFRGKNDLL